MLKSCGRFALLMCVARFAVADNTSALALKPLSSRKAPKYFLALVLPLMPAYSQDDPAHTVALEDFLAAPKDPIKMRVYLKSVLAEYWGVRMHLGRAMTGNALQDADGSLSARKNVLEDGIRELLAQLIHSESDRETMKRWSKRERMAIPWNLGPRRLGASL